GQEVPSFAITVVAVSIGVTGTRFFTRVCPKNTRVNESRCIYTCIQYGYDDRITIGVQVEAQVPSTLRQNIFARQEVAFIHRWTDQEVQRETYIGIFPHSLRSTAAGTCIYTFTADHVVNTCCTPELSITTAAIARADFDAIGYIVFADRFTQPGAQLSCGLIFEEYQQFILLEQRFSAGIFCKAFRRNRNETLLVFAPSAAFQYND